MRHRSGTLQPQKPHGRNRQAVLRNQSLKVDFTTIGRQARRGGGDKCDGEGSSTSSGRCGNSSTTQQAQRGRRLSAILVGRTTPRRIQVEVLVLAHIRVKGTLRREQRRNCFPQGGLEKGFGTLEDAPPAGNGLAPGSKGIRCRLSCSAASSVSRRSHLEARIPSQRRLATGAEPNLQTLRRLTSHSGRRSRRSW